MPLYVSFFKGKDYNYCAAFLNKGLFQRELSMQEANRRSDLLLFFIFIFSAVGPV